MTFPELSTGAQAALAKESLLLKAFEWIGENPYSRDSNPAGIINAGVAANATIKDDLLRKLNSMAGGFIESDLEYNWSHGNPELRREIAGVFNRHFNPATAVNPDDIVVTNGCTGAIEMLSFAMCEPGDHILIPTPCYGALDNDMSTRARAVATPVKLPMEETMTVSQISYFERAIADIERSGGRARALFLMSPHNPLGVSYPRDVLRRFFEFARRHNLFVVVDEIYALSVFDHSDAVTPFESVLSWTDMDSHIDPKSVVVIHGLSKDFGLNGFRMGWILSPWNKELLATVKKYAFFGYRPAYTDRLIASLLADHSFIDSLLSVSQRRLAEHYKVTVDFLDAHGIRYIPCSAGHFIWLQLPIAACNKVLLKQDKITLAQVPSTRWTVENELAVWENLVCNEHHQKQLELRAKRVWVELEDVTWVLGKSDATVDGSGTEGAGLNVAAGLVGAGGDGVCSAVVVVDSSVQSVSWMYSVTITSVTISTVRVGVMMVVEVRSSRMGEGSAGMTGEDIIGEGSIGIIGDGSAGIIGDGIMGEGSTGTMGDGSTGIIGDGITGEGSAGIIGDGSTGTIGDGSTGIIGDGIMGEDSTGTIGDGSAGIMGDGSTGAGADGMGTTEVNDISCQTWLDSQALLSVHVAAGVSSGLMTTGVNSITMTSWLVGIDDTGSGVSTTMVLNTSVSVSEDDSDHSEELGDAGSDALGGTIGSGWLGSIGSDGPGTIGSGDIGDGAIGSGDIGSGDIGDGIIGSDGPGTIGSGWLGTAGAGGGLAT
ncbi:hypothetical protein GGI07_001183 [Coemansia sp. Benny D115]|nr:hypothetical protein GGI07_001183 [Coemansia sp. Benny D115]